MSSPTPDPQSPAITKTPAHTRTISVDELALGDVVYRTCTNDTVAVLGLLVAIDRGVNGSAALLLESCAEGVHHRVVLATADDVLRTSRR